MRLAEQLRPAIGHLNFKVYEGDVTRAPLTPEQVYENERWMQGGELRLLNGERYFTNPELDPQCGLPLYSGAILDVPILEFDRYNLVTTNGKGLLLDRLYALGGPPAAIVDQGVGDDATAAAVGNTKLVNAGGTNVLLQAFDALPTRAGLVVTAVTTYATGSANFNWQETGQFNGGTNGTSTIFNRIAPIGAFNKTSAVSIALTQTTTQS